MSELEIIEKQFLEDLQAEDILGAVIRGCLHIEAGLIQLIENRLQQLEVVDLTRIGFERLAEWAVALGRLRQDSLSSFRILHAIRNRFAHKVNYKITESDVIEIENGLSPRLKGILNRQFTEKWPNASIENRLRYCIVILYIDVTTPLEVAFSIANKSK